MKGSRLSAVILVSFGVVVLMTGCSHLDGDSTESRIFAPACEPAAKLTISANAVAGTPERPRPTPVDGSGAEIVLNGDLRFRFAVDGCRRIPSTRNAGDFLSAVVDGNALFLSHTLNTYCNASEQGVLALRPVVDGHQITLNEVFTGPAVRCLCDIPVRLKIDGLEPGIYTIPSSMR